VIVDAHHHLWRRDRADYGFLQGLPGSIDRDVVMTDLIPTLRRLGIDRTVVVQGTDADGDTDVMLEEAAAHPEIGGVVGWVPLDRPEAAAARLAELRRTPVFRGVRAAINTQPDPEWLLRDDVAEGLRLLEDADVPFDLVSVRRRHLDLVPELVERHPRLRIVIDHLSKPPIARDELEPWWTNIARAAGASPRVFAKVSGLMPARTPYDRWTIDDLRPFIDRVVDSFGPDRLMWGSDWPIIDLAGGYERAWDAAHALVADWSSADRDALFGGTAIRFYALETE
jgi:L-fuconolactonase